MLWILLFLPVVLFLIYHTLQVAEIVIFSYASFFFIHDFYVCVGVYIVALC